MTSFLPAGVELPKKKNGSYINKFDDGETRFRILEIPGLTFFSAFSFEKGEKGGSVRGKTVEEVENAGFALDGFGAKVKFTLALKVLHFNNPKKPSDGGAVKILQFTQVSIMEAFQNFELSEDYGDLTKFDIIVTKTGVKKDTKYSVMPTPPPSKELEVITEAFEAAQSIDLSKLLTDENPFETSENVAAPESVSVSAKDIF